MVPAAEALGMTVIGYDPFLTADDAARISETLTFTDDVNDLYNASDFVTLHIPATGDNIGFVNADAISQMKDGAIILNFARDTLVDEAALAQALSDGKISAYVTDFATPGVLAMENTIVIPHLGASTAEAEENCAVMAVNEVMDYLDTGTKTHCVNMKD
ncbi:MAG: hypothetical protein LUB61_05080 [Eggerthellaceae bacterium]|nr:hypothetical protein [Eggerthellaceae bacterium]